MTRVKTKVLQDGEGASVHLPKDVAQQWAPGTDASLWALSKDALLLRRGDTATQDFFACTLTSLGMDELFGYVLSGVRTGKLTVQSEGATRSVHFRDGQVVFAASTEPYERLGTALVRLDLLTPSGLASALREVRPGAKLGQVLTRKGLLTPAKLYAGMTFLVREIVLSLFCLSHGTAFFAEGGAPPEDELKLPDATRDLVLEGIRLSEEVRRLRAKLRPDVRVAQAGTAPADERRALWERAGTGTEVRLLRASFQGGEHAFLSAVSDLLESGQLAVRPRTHEEVQAFSRSDAPKVLDRYRHAILLVCRSLVQAGHDLSDLRSFLSDPLPGMEDAFSGVRLEDDGSLDLDRVLQNLGDKPESRARAYEALNAFVSYALFSARNVLPPEDAAHLSDETRSLYDEGSS